MRKMLMQVVSVLALANLAAVVGLVAFLFATGRLDGERVELIAAVIRGEFTGDEDDGEAPTAQPAEKTSAETQIAHAKEEQDLAHRLAEREIRELNDRQRLADAMLLDVVHRAEKLDADRDAFEMQQKKSREERLQSGFVKELELLASVKPKMRKDLLRQKSDADVVKLMMEMDDRAGKQVVEACKTPPEKAWIGRILHQIQTVNDTPSARAEQAEQEAQ